MYTSVYMIKKVSVMKCARCGLEVPDGVKQCPKCGMINEFKPSETPKKKIKPIYYIIGALALIALLGLTVALVTAKQKNVMSAGNGVPGPPGNIMSGPNGKNGNGNLLSAPPGGNGLGDRTIPDSKKPNPPAEVVDYLNYVKKVEDHRQMLLKDTTQALMLSTSSQTQSLLSMIDMAMDPDGAKARDPLADTKKELCRQYKNWLSTLDFFDKKTAPSECREFSGAYRNVLFNETKAIGEVTVSFNSVNVMNPQDLSKLLASLEKMKGDPSIQKGIDDAADNADGKLDTLVANYNMKKPFDVPREQKTSGNIMGF